MHTVRQLIASLNRYNPEDLVDIDHNFSDEAILVVNRVHRVMDSHLGLISTRNLTRMDLSDILEQYRPGSRDWTWDDERQDLVTRDYEVTEAMRQTILQKGFGFADNSEPILLGNDGRVWDGHHRLILAMIYSPQYLMVELAPEGARRNG